MATLDSPRPVPDCRAAGTTNDRAAGASLTLRLVAVSPCSDRREMIWAAAEAEAWEAIVSRDAGEFRRALFRHGAAAALVDLPASTDAQYESLRQAAEEVPRMMRGLLTIVGAAGGREEEVWARSLGAWAYFNRLATPRSLEVTLADMRLAVVRSLVLAARASAVRADAGSPFQRLTAETSPLRPPESDSG